ncbi:MAG TPA: bifunctional riboflavin kinase/FAD synthetase [Anaerolineales bacterium]|jgi:riboflavin kinase/FMN adenylyltransferase
MQQHFRSLDAARLNHSWLTIGVFDGVHRGHQKIIHQLTAGAHAEGAPAVVITFNPHPANVLAGRDIKNLTTPDERAAIFFGLGVDAVISMEFTRELSEHSAEDFMASIKRQLGLRKLITGYDFALGKNRAGNFERLTLIGQQLDYEVLAVEPMRLNDEVISSTLIRQYIAEGAVRQAAEKLGRFYMVSGAVIAGDGRGRTIGIPTANLDFPTEKAIPANGVYACWATVDAQKHRAVANIGLRPTFTSGAVLPRVEAHLLDHNSDLYGREVRLEFVEHLRAEQKFAGVEALITQIRVDIEAARELL